MRGASRWAAAPMLAAAALLAPGCTPGQGEETAKRTDSLARPAPECGSTPPAPKGFRAVSHQHVEFDDHVGSRVRLKAPDGRALFYNVGIPGEFAEGADLRAIVSVLDGHEGSLYGAGSVWIITWEEQGPCGANVVIGNGFTRRGFLATMTAAGLLNRRD